MYPRMEISPGSALSAHMQAERAVSCQFYRGIHDRIINFQGNFFIIVGQYGLMMFAFCKRSSTFKPFFEVNDNNLWNREAEI
jgi:hypothetical protein